MSEDGVRLVKGWIVRSAAGDFLRVVQAVDDIGGFYRGAVHWIPERDQGTRFASKKQAEEAAKIYPGADAKAEHA